MRRSPTLQPSRFALEHTPQGSTAQSTTEPLERGPAVAGETHVAAWPRAGKIVVGVGLMIALAIALGRGVLQAPLGVAGAPSMRLLTTVAPSLIAGSIEMVGSPLRPLAGRLPTGCAAISRERMLWLERLLAPFQQAETLPAMCWGLPGRRTGIFWTWAQGRYCSRRSSLGAKRQLRTEASLRARLPAGGIQPGSYQFIANLPPEATAEPEWPALRRDPLTAAMARLSRETGTLIDRY
jgi:hypothetical protein